MSLKSLGIFIVYNSRKTIRKGEGYDETFFLTFSTEYLHFRTVQTVVSKLRGEKRPSKGPLDFL